MLVFTISFCTFEAVKQENYFSSKFSARSILMLCVINEIFAFSLLGEQIQHESAMIADEIYSSNWYKLNFVTSDAKVLKEFKATMQVTMMRASRKVKISAAGIVTMCFETFMNVSQ